MKDMKIEHQVVRQRKGLEGYIEVEEEKPL